MKLTIAEIFSAKGPMEELGKAKLPVPVSLAVMKLIKKLNEHLIPAQQVHNNLIKQYGKITEDGPNKGKMAVQPGDENWQNFTEELGELMQQKVDIVHERIALPDSLEIEPAVLMVLERFIKTT